MKLNCTKKTIQAFGLDKNHLDSSLPDNKLFTWHAHIVSMARSKILIAVNDETFFTVIIPGVNKKMLVNIDEHFFKALLDALQSEGFQDQHANYLLGMEFCLAKPIVVKYWA